MKINDIDITFFYFSQSQSTSRSHSLDQLTESNVLSNQKKSHVNMGVPGSGNLQDWPSG